MSTWSVALYKWNAKKPTYCLPKKGTAQYQQVKKIQSTITQADVKKYIATSRKKQQAKKTSSSLIRKKYEEAKRKARLKARPKKVIKLPTKAKPKTKTKAKMTQAQSLAKARKAKTEYAKKRKTKKTTVIKVTKVKSKKPTQTKPTQAKPTQAKPTQALISKFDMKEVKLLKMKGLKPNIREAFLKYGVKDNTAMFLKNIKNDLTPKAIKSINKQDNDIVTKVYDILILSQYNGKEQNILIKIRDEKEKQLDTVIDIKTIFMIGDKSWHPLYHKEIPGLKKKNNM